MTPPTLAQVPAEGSWRARAFENRYPITSVHEVVVDTPRHVLTFADLEPDEARTALSLYQARARSMHERRLGYLLFRNEGPNAGGSIPHSHAQIVGEADGFPRSRRAAAHDDGPADLVHEEQGVAAYVPDVGRFPYELWVRPTDADTPFHTLDGGMLESLAGIVLDASRGMQERTGDKGWNLVLHQAAGRWRFELLPRTEKFAGLELGGEVYVNAVDAEVARDAWLGWFGPS